MASSIIRAPDLRPRPWPNGLGTTRDVASGEGWQMGVADLAGEAAFSHFAGLDRVFTIIKGAGATLELEGRGPLPCPPLVPTSFPGDVPTYYRPRAGAGRAFNVITDRAMFEARVAVCSIAASHQVGLPVGCLAVFCAEGAVEMGGKTLEAGDTMLHPGPEPVRAASVAAIVIVVELHPKQG
ncbi:HutD family protein [Roseomonas chloroacetimidivorans]|uniref:HutD/Ves family protein n=1 Tax=Roseomonas chloroacetimidivorans TaxID=1766656 RepID=UPI003C75B655